MWKLLIFINVAGSNDFMVYFFIYFHKCFNLQEFKNCKACVLQSTPYNPPLFNLSSIIPYIWCKLHRVSDALFKFIPLLLFLGAIVLFLLPCLTSIILSLQYQKQCIYHHHGVYIMDIYATLCCLAFALILYNSSEFSSKSKLVYGVVMLIMTLSIMVEISFAIVMVKQNTIKENSKLNQRGKTCTSQIKLYLKALTGMSALQFLVLSVTFDIKKKNTLELLPTGVVWEILSEKYAQAYPEPFQTSKMERFAKIVNNFKQLTPFSR